MQFVVQQVLVLFLRVQSVLHPSSASLSATAPSTLMTDRRLCRRQYYALWQITLERAKMQLAWQSDLASSGHNMLRTCVPGCDHVLGDDDIM